MAWTKKHPTCAAIFWSEGFRYLRSNDPTARYAGMQILDRCWRFDDPELVLEEMDIIKQGVR